MTLTQYNTTVGHTGIDRLCLAQKCYRTRTKLAEVGKPPPLQVGEDVTIGVCNPWPILEEDKIEIDSEIKISYDFLKESSDIFENWKAN